MMNCWWIHFEHYLVIFKGQYYMKGWAFLKQRCVKLSNIFFPFSTEEIDYSTSHQYAYILWALGPMKSQQRNGNWGPIPLSILKHCSNTPTNAFLLHIVIMIPIKSFGVSQCLLIFFCQSFTIFLLYIDVGSIKSNIYRYMINWGNNELSIITFLTDPL